VREVLKVYTVATVLAIELSADVYRRLLERVTSFSDTAEDVIVRLLDAAEREETGSVSSYRQGSRANPGSILPEREYWRPILRIVEAAGGSAVADDVIETLEAEMRDVFKARDLDRLKTGEVRWRNRARFARLRMREQGLLSDTSHRGIWEITEAGREYLARDQAH
jgi:predicted CopG family antitoxin